jgi:hypothetical protein
MRLLFYLLPTFLLFFNKAGLCQNKLFDQNFRFKDGIYLNFEQLIKNKPAINMNPIIGSYINNTNLNRRILKELPLIKIGTETKQINMDQLWAICINGVPMKVMNMRLQIQNTRNSIMETEPVYFLTRFSMIGKLTYYQMPRDRRYWTTTIDYVLKYDDLNTYKLNKRTIVSLISDDHELLEKFKNEPNKKKNILIYLSEYNRRNPVNVKE